MNYIEKVDTGDFKQIDSVWCLPRFVTTQTKFHIIYDGAVQFHGTSINYHILPGPDFLTSLFNVLSQLGLGKYAITADLIFLLNS